MTFEEMIQVLKSEFPNKTIDLSESLELLKEVISDTMTSIEHQSREAFNQRNFTIRKHYDELAELIASYEEKIDSTIVLLALDNPLPDSLDDSLEEVERRKIPDYSQYTVDTNVVHTLMEDFTHKRPNGFRFRGEQFYAETWVDMLKQTTELLMNINKNKIMSFESNPSMNGKIAKYFSSTPDLMRKPISIQNGMYLETNQSANTIRNTILKMLRAYGFTMNDYQVFLRADFTELNQ